MDDAALDRFQAYLLSRGVSETASRRYFLLVSRTLDVLGAHPEGTSMEEYHTSLPFPTRRGFRYAWKVYRRFCEEEGIPVPVEGPRGKAGRPRNKDRCHLPDAVVAGVRALAQLDEIPYTAISKLTWGGVRVGSGGKVYLQAVLDRQGLSAETRDSYRSYPALSPAGLKGLSFLRVWALGKGYVELEDRSKEDLSKEAPIPLVPVRPWGMVPVSPGMVRYMVLKHPTRRSQ